MHTCTAHPRPPALPACRVPQADATLAHAPAELSDEEALLLGDILSTGFFCAHNAGIAELAAQAANLASSGGGDGGPVVAVVGCGPVGLLACVAARALGAARVLAVDSVPERLALAQRFGAEPVNREQADPLEVVRCGGAGAVMVPGGLLVFA